MPINTHCTFSHEKLDHTKSNEGHLMVTLEAPERDINRTPLCSILVLDVSGSMSGHMGEKSKIEGLREVSRCLVQQLSAQDEIAIVTYTDTSEVVLARMKVADKNAIYAAINNLRSQNSTNMGAGLIDGFRQVSQDFSGLKRIFLVSDGLNNHGMSNSQVLDLVKNRKEYGSGISVSTFGIGLDCDQEMMADLAKFGEGNYYYISNSSDMRETFARELGGALACDAQNIEIRIKPNNGNEVLEILNDFTVENENGVAIVRAEDLYVGEKRHVLVKMKIDKVDHPKPRKTSIVHVTIKYHDLQTGKSIQEDEENIKVEFVSPDEADKNPKLEVQEQVAILSLAAASLKAVAAANRGDFHFAKSIYDESMGLVSDAIAAGSSFCASIQDEALTRGQMWSRETYTLDAGTKCMTDASNTRKYRGSAVGMSAHLFTTRNARKMMDEFSPEKGQSMPPAQPQSPVHLQDPPVEKEEAKGFIKKRSGKTG